MGGLRNLIFNNIEKYHIFLSEGEKTYRFYIIN